MSPSAPHTRCDVSDPISHNMKGKVRGLNDKNSKQKYSLKGLLCWLSGKESTCRSRRPRFDPWLRKIPWRRKWPPTPVFLPGKSHGQRNLVDYCPWSHKRAGHDLMTEFIENQGPAVIFKVWSPDQQHQQPPGNLSRWHIPRPNPNLPNQNLWRLEPNNLCFNLVILTKWFQRQENVENHCQGKQGREAGAQRWRCDEEAGLSGRLWEFKALRRDCRVDPV